MTAAAATYAITIATNPITATSCHEGCRHQFNKKCTGHGDFLHDHHNDCRDHRRDNRGRNGRLHDIRCPDCTVFSHLQDKNVAEDVLRGRSASHSCNTSHSYSHIPPAPFQASPVRTAAHMSAITRMPPCASGMVSATSARSTMISPQP